MARSTPYSVRSQELQTIALTATPRDKTPEHTKSAKLSVIPTD